MLVPGLEITQSQTLLIAGILLIIGVIFISVVAFVSQEYKFFQPSQASDYSATKLSLIQRILIYSAGANSQVIQKIAISYPPEADRYSKMGALVLLITIYATLSGIFAIKTLTSNSVVYITSGVLWGCYIFSIDRLMLSFMRSKWYIGVVRIFMAGFISLTISVPIELCLFEKEISAQQQDALLADRTRVSAQASHQKEIDALNGEIKEFEYKISEQQTKRDEANKQMIAEAENQNRPGKGPLYGEKHDNYIFQVNELASIKAKYQPLIDEKRKQINNLLQDSQSQIDQNMAAKEVSNGLLARLEYLTSLTTKYASMWLGHWVIRILLLLIEISPVLVKMLTPESLYEQYLANEEKRYKLQMASYLAWDQQVFDQFSQAPNTQPIPQHLQNIKNQFATTILNQYQTSRTQPLNFSSQTNP